MNEKIKELIEKIRGMNKGFNVCSVWETNEEYIFIDDRIGMPPYIADKKTLEIRRVFIENRNDMIKVHKESKLVYRIQGSDT